VLLFVDRAGRSPAIAKTDPFGIGRVTETLRNDIIRRRDSTLASIMIHCLTAPNGFKTYWARIEFDDNSSLVTAVFPNTTALLGYLQTLTFDRAKVGGTA
jgi:hypothetical protein